MVKSQVNFSIDPHILEDFNQKTSNSNKSQIIEKFMKNYAQQNGTKDELDQKIIELEAKLERIDDKISELEAEKAQVNTELQSLMSKKDKKVRESQRETEMTEFFNDKAYKYDDYSSFDEFKSDLSGLYGLYENSVSDPFSESEFWESFKQFIENEVKA